MRIAVDAMGGDHAPEPIVQGSLKALCEDDALHLTLVGDEPQIQPLLDLPDEHRARLTLVHTSEVVGMEESPGKALRSKPNSSINLCWRLLAEGKVDGMVSAGNTGAVVAGGLLSRRFLKHIRKPGIAVTMPTRAGFAVVIDVGANSSPKASHLLHYAIMGQVFARQLLNKQQPKIGLLNIGSEESKGSDLAKETVALFQQSKLKESFYGNVEGRDIFSGVVDVVVCDGFVGNVLLKTCEGMVDFLLHAVGHELFNTLHAERDKAKQALLSLKGRFDYAEFGGAPLLGIDGVSLICHGHSGARAIFNAVRRAKEYVTINQLIAGEMETALAGMTMG